jgi:hypothetical protein
LAIQNWVQPTVEVVLPESPVTTDTTPKVAWVGTFDSDSSGYRFAQVKVFTAAVAEAGGFDPDVDTPVASTDELVYGSVIGAWDVDVNLPDDDYYAYVRVADLPTSEPNWSDWSDGWPFTVTVPRPAEPMLTLTGEDEFGRIRVTVTDGAVGDVDTQYWEVQRQADDGTWYEVRSLQDDGIVYPVSGIGTAFDYEAPNGDESTIRVRACHLNAVDGGFDVACSDWVQDSKGWTSLDYWLKHPFNPTLNRKVTLRDAPSRARAARQSATTPLGRSDPVIVSDTRLTWAGTVAFRSSSDEDRFYLESLVEDGTPLLLQAPRAAYFDDFWAVYGDLTQDRVVPADWIGTTFDSTPYTQVLRPEGNLIEAPDPTPPAEPGDDLLLL